ncbi:hypothetical protein Mycsm_06920 (plasmid) [Mycobacterium sp. JS623]|uniref:hypothetical protein n=1 Tax=Mycobacterium sp. JS623 TaxID=212767 RepID=UPI0002A57F95|nr:hypothetical protein [Mycobacterium sp. JS623]AGB27023.1 hypothetical protein Mycsm_06920 [Mycobacterium sp. JS623]
MGFNTTVVIRNDGLAEIGMHAEEFVMAVKSRMATGGEIAVGRHANVATVHAADHADAVVLIAVGGNYSTKVYTGTYAGPHHTEDGAAALLKQWAESLGYRLTRP